MKTSCKKNLLNRMMGAGIVCGVLGFVSVVQAQFYPYPPNGDIIGITTSTSITNSTLSNVGTEIPITIRLWGQFIITNTAVGPTASPLLRVNLNAEEESWATLDPSTGVEQVNESGLKTKVTFKYRIREGDMVAKLRIAGADGSSVSGTPYGFDWKTYGIVRQSNIYSNAVWRFNPSYVEYPGVDPSHYDFSYRNVSIKTMQFGSTPGPVQVGETVTWSVTTANAVSTGRTVNCYVWVSNSVPTGGSVNLDGVKAKKLTINEGESSASFTIEGLTVGTNTVYLQGTQDYADNATAGVLNYEAHQIIVTPAPAPYVSLRLQDVTDPAFMRVPETSGTSSGKLRVRFSQSYAQDVWVRLDTVLNSIPTAAQTNNLIFNTSPYYALVQAGQTESADIPFRAPDGTTPSDLYGIAITPVITNVAASSFFTGTPVGCLVAVSNVAPVVTTPKVTDVLTASRGVPFKFTWKVTDASAQDVASGMTVTWSFGDGTTNELGSGAEGEIYHTFNESLTRTVTVYATDKDGALSEEIQFTVNVVEPTPAPSLSFVFDQTPAKYAETTDPNTASFKLLLSQSYSVSDMNVLLTFTDPQSNIQLAVTNVVIPKSTSQSEDVLFSLLDGTLLSGVNGVSITPVILTAAASNVYTDVRAGRVYVTNVPPRLVSPANQADLTLAAVTPYHAVPMASPFAFNWEISDVTADNSNMVIDWDFGDNTTLTVTNGLIGKIYHTYTSLGDKIVKVRATDKDGGRSSLVQFKVTVVAPLPEPTVYVRPPAGVLTETTSSGTGSIDVELSEAFTNKVTVLLAVSPANSSVNGAILLATNVVEFRVGETLKTVKVSARDGTALSELTGFIVTPSVLTNTAAYLHFQEMVPGIVEVSNADPEILSPNDSTDLTVPLYTIAQGASWPFYWSIRDVAADLAGSEMKVTWTFGDGSTVVTNGGSGSLTHTYNVSGSMTVLLVAEDKDGGRDEIRFSVLVSPAKAVNVTPIGPNYEANYWGASGLGNGMVFSDSAIGQINKNDVYFFRYGPGESSATLRAVPYKTDTVSGLYVVTNFDNNGTAVPGVTYDKDSFFYVWVGTDQGLADQALNPAQAGPTVVVTLPASTTAANGTSSSVDIRDIQAIFSREWRVADNMGDINQDGIPDKIATQYNLPTLASGTATTTGSSTPIELTNVGSYNKDKDAAGTEVGDFLPGAASGGSAIIGGISNVFATVGDPFTAILEIRGFHLGLNSETYNSDPDFGAGESDRSCERPTDPTLQDTDGDNFPDGWEYYFWYNSKIKGVTGMAYTPTNVAVGTLIPSKSIVTAFDPLIPATDAETGAAINRDLDNDGLSDIEELSIGTNPIQWDTDYDGVCDGWEVLRGLNPNDQRDVLNVTMNNTDGDYMAYADVPRILVTLEGGRLCLVSSNALVTVGEALGLTTGVTTCYRYGGTNAPFAVGLAITTLVDQVVLETSITNVILLHNQVFQEFGFDPRVAWAGTVNPLSHPQRFPEWVAGLTAEGIVTAPHTKPFTALDEYLLLKYMAELRLNGCDGTIGDGDAGQKTADWTVYSTHPLTPDSDVVWGAGGAVTKTDCMPDGWELYISMPPGYTGSTMFISPWDAYDGEWTFVGEDNLSNQREFHGTDCSSGYTNIALYGADYPVVTIVRPASDADWVNKFWPTSPYLGDTDGDGLSDDAEMTFVYGSPVTDSGSTCTPGGGLNPCAMDTDSDQLPDPWEAAFAFGGSAAGVGCTSNGMDGTVADWAEDYDRDGLANYQEYWVQAVRSFRYDIPPTLVPMTGEAGPSVFFTPVTNDWDFCKYPWGTEAQNLKVLLPAGGAYVSTDPRDPDSDGDGMDDYYEMFHGLNPILGDPVLPKGDLISLAYGLKIGYAYNAFYTASTPFAMDFVQFPWLAGLDEADPDADGLRNMEEQLQADSAAPSCSNTDPSPLWMTDVTYPGSLTQRFYRPGDMFFWPGDPDTLAIMEALDFKMFSFEMNEGYDTDNDGLCDKSEMLQTATTQSDPQNHDDPVRRQALWFSGDESAAQSMFVWPKNEWLFRSFTVELWACPDRVYTTQGQVLIERPIIYGPSDLSTDGNVVRVNFRIGIDPNGQVYAMYQNAGVHDDSTGVVMAKGPILTADKWVHLVARMDGEAGKFHLFVDGKVEKEVGTTLIPANGVINVLAYPDSGQYPDYTWRTVRSGVFLLGASKLDTEADYTFPDWEDYAQFYQGYIDEVRIWDGARSDLEIRTDYKKRYGREELLANRRSIRLSEYSGGSRVPGVYPQLPPELMAHYTFDNLFGADREASVAQVPRGFNSAGVAINRPSDFVDAYATLSSVYTDYGYLLWIENGVDHLPIFGGIVLEGTNAVLRDANTVLDSFSWSHYAAGVYQTPPSSNNLEKYEFPNSNNPYGFWYKHSLDFLTLDGEGVKVGSDLLPMGGAWAKQAVTMWDNDSPAGVWADMAVDDDADGLADWWEVDVAPTYFGTSAVGWYTLAANGMTAGELYMRDLAKGYTEANHPGAVGYDEDALVAQTSDIDGDGLPDWWENLFNLSPTDSTGNNGAMGDADLDGLSNYAEYLISEVYPFDRMSRPDKFRTSAVQTQSDYFVKQGLLYYGQMFADHDFMEDEWEDNFDAYYVSRYLYDAHMDWDEDGWSNWSECRYGVSALRSDPTLTMHLSPEGGSVKDFPIPVIKAQFSYNGIRPIGDLLLQAYSKPSMNGIPDAVWHVQTSASGTVADSVKYLGYWGPKTIKGVLSPGSLVPGSLIIEMVDVADNDGSVVSVYAGYDIGNATAMSGVICGKSPLGLLEAIGTINYVTGEYEIDLAWFEGMTLSRMVSPTVIIMAKPENSYIKVSYQSKLVSGWPKNLYLSDAMTPTATEPSLGYVKEGTNYFFAALDVNGNGRWDAGEPCGVADTFGVDIGYDANDLKIELTDYTPGYLRMALNPVQRSEDVLAGTVAQGSSSSTAQAGLENRVVVKRISIDGSKTYQSTVLDKTLLSTRAFVHEGDFLAEGNYALDWGLSGVPTTMSRLTAVYEVYLGGTTNVAYSFTNTFDAVRAKAQPSYPVNNGYVYAARPTFKWTMPDNYTAFTVEIRRLSSTGPLVYSSGVVQAPTRNTDREFVWTAPISAGMRTPTGQIFSSNMRYYWRVSALNAKFSNTTTGVNWSDWQVFRLDVNPPLDSAGYGAVKAVVKYDGPATTLLTGRVKVQAFHNAAFSGQPEAEVTLAGTGLTTLTDPNDMTTNAVICGLAPSAAAGDYYIRAFIDHNQNGVRDVWESWGYANYYGITDKPYDPYVVKVKYVPLAECETVEIHIEDADTDQDWFPDAWEYEQHPTASDFLALTGPGTGSDGDPDYEINPNLAGTTGLSTLSVMSALLVGTTDADGDGLDDLTELILGSDAQKASTADDGFSDSEKLSLGVAPADTFTAALTSVGLDDSDATVQWKIGVVESDTVNRTLLSSLAVATGTIQFEVLFTPSLQNPDWQVIASESVTLEDGAGGLSTRIARTQQALMASPAQGFFRIRLVPSAQ